MNIKYIINSCKRNGREIERSYDNYDIARFEYSCLCLVDKWTVLFMNDCKGIKQLKINVLET